MPASVHRRVVGRRGLGSAATQLMRAVSWHDTAGVSSRDGGEVLSSCRAHPGPAFDGVCRRVGFWRPRQPRQSVFERLQHFTGRSSPALRRSSAWLLLVHGPAVCSKSRGGWLAGAGDKGNQVVGRGALRREAVQRGPLAMLPAAVAPWARAAASLRRAARGWRACRNGRRRCVFGLAAGPA